MPPAAAPAFAAVLRRAPAHRDGPVRRHDERVARLLPDARMVQTHVVMTATAGLHTIRINCAGRRPIM